VEGVGDLVGVGEHGVGDGPVGAGQVHGHPLDSGPPLLGPSGEPSARTSSVTALDDVKKLTVTDQLGGPDPLAVGTEADERGLVQPEDPHGTDAVGVVDQREAVGDHGAVDGVPVTADLGDRAAVASDLFARPPGGPVGHAAVADHDPLVDLGPRTYRAVGGGTAPAALAPHRERRTAEAGQVDQPAASA
jgi:hypothetical protein